MANKAYPPSICPGIPRLGICPSGWTTCTFNDILTVVERPIPIDDDTVYQLVTAKRNRGGIVPREQLKGREIKTQGQYAVRAGDFLIGNRQIIHGACGIVPESLDGAIVSGEYTVLLPKKDLYLPWLSYFAHTVHFQQTCFQSSIGVDVEKMVFKVDWWLKQRLHVPPLAEQHKIAAILSTWETAIEETRTLIAAAKRRKKAVVQKLLSEYPCNTGHKKDWTKQSLSEIANLQNDKYDPATTAENPTCVELEHIESGSGRLTGSVLAKQQSSIKNRFQPGDVLFGKLRPYLRKHLLATFPGVCSTEIWVLRPNCKECLPAYLHALVQTDQFLTAATVSSGSKMPRAEWSFVADCVFLIPPIPEQHIIASILTTADDEIRQLEAKAGALERQKKGLMQKLLTGEIRTRQTR